ncbi:hypothetical protein [Mesobacillus foraminis]|uniref:hypothetical protein n=1 Tax=Mesobacillus foraminis TaxID=279826 RepID=UPI000EF46340|nr:hypothetical protein [Mesobacillus foraminis]
MKQEYTNKKFVKTVILLVVIMMTLTASLGYMLDPSLYYRLPKHYTYFSEAFTTAGLMKNSPAEIAIVGSSMMQNTDMDLVRNEFGQRAVKYTRSGMNIDEITMLIDRATSLEKNNVDKFILNIDMTTFNSEPSSPYDKFPKYLYDENKINDIKYLLGFETWTKFIPFNFVYNTSINFDTPITNKVVNTFSKTTNIDLMGDWSFGTQFSEEIVKSKYENNLESVSKQNIDGMYERMKQRFDKEFYPVIYNNTDKEFMIILPPYSALMWYEAEKQGYAEILFDFKKYMVTRFSGLDNVKIYDFQDYEGIINLNNYKDTTHYIPEFNDMMIKSLAVSKNVIDVNNVDTRISNLKNIVLKFKTQHKKWL